MAGTRVDYVRSADVVVRMHGRTAIVTGRIDWKLTTNGQSSPETTRRYTATYVPGGPLRWRMVALHIGRTS